MIHQGHGRPRLSLLIAGTALLVAVSPLAACAEVQDAASSGYHPSAVESVKGSELKRVVLTAEGARRVGVATAPVRVRGEDRVIPYAALIYDGKGTPYVYTRTDALTFMRAEVVVDRVEGSRVLITQGPRPGIPVVTVGASEIYGTELGIDGGH
jgi:hypothetical protein